MPKQDSKGNWVPTEAEIQKAAEPRRSSTIGDRMKPSTPDTPEEAAEARRRATLIEQTSIQ
ncbi:MAG: hypothetical protein KF736_00645 [Acidobacteria bacterium]|nr:hypothetical protein [Acidobacteriota bacterium]MCW5947982.1 hypothetical protein [Pyrinomonadaceae bacterium]